jgi:hypothetical protein
MHDVKSLQHRKSPGKLGWNNCETLRHVVAMENVVNAPHVIKSCLPIATISINLVGVGVKVHHVSGLFGGLRAGIHCHTDIRLRQRRSVVGAITGHGNQFSLGSLTPNQSPACL